MSRPKHTLGDAPIQPEYIEQMNQLARNFERSRSSVGMNAITASAQQWRDARDALVEIQRSMPDTFRWHERELAQFFRAADYVIAYDDGRLSLREVGELFGCTKQNVSAFLRRHGIRPVSRSAVEGVAVIAR